MQFPSIISDDPLQRAEALWLYETSIIDRIIRSFRNPRDQNSKSLMEISSLWQDFSDEYDVADIGEDDFLKLVCTWGKLLTDGEFSYFVYDETFANAIVPNAIMPNAIILNVSLIYCLDTHKFLRATMQGSESLPFSLPLSFKKKLDDHIAEIMLED